MKTPKGQMCYRMNLEQIRNAVLETAYIGVMNAYLQCKTYTQKLQDIYGQQLSGDKIKKQMMIEVEDWAVVQVRPHS
jgi:hypothetical protein